MNGQTLHDHAPLLDALQQLTAMAPGLPATYVDLKRYADGDYLDLCVSIGVNTGGALALWKSALGGTRTDVGEDDTWRYHRVTAHLGDVRVEVNYTHQVPA